MSDCFPELFVKQANKTPHAIALVSSGDRWTYGELNRKANQLAHLLSSLGVGAETLVGLYMDRSILMLVSILATFKVGGAYIPLDPAYPLERMAYMLDDAKPQVIISTPQYASLLPPISAILLCIDSTWQAVAHWSDENLDGLIVPEQAAYVIYTSGSTGHPKGAVLTQQGLLNHLLAKIDTLALHSSDTIAQTASHCFDISVWQFLAALLVGGQVHIISDETIYDPVRLFTYVTTEHISVLEVVPTMLRVTLDAWEHRSEQTAPSLCLRWLLVTGEVLPVDLCQRWLRLYHHIPLINAYGPTECSDDVTHYILTTPPPSPNYPVPIGTAIANTQLYVLDTHFAPTAVGVPGELYVGGLGVGRGYLRNPARTAQSFLPDPFTQKQGARLYRTGDLVRRLSDGNLAFLGRVDEQVKVRGYRVELGEIEAVLAQHSSVQNCIVIVRDDHLGNKHLIAYLVLGQNRSVQFDDIKQFLRTRLPEYMVPAQIILLDTFPLTPNGKIDRARLPVPEQKVQYDQQGFVAPCTPLELFLANIWQEILRVQKIGIQQNFFDLGGDSIKAAIFINRLQEHLQATIYVVAVFDAPTIAQMSSYLSQHYPTSIARLFGLQSLTAPGEHKTHSDVDEKKINHFRHLLSAQQIACPAPVEKNAPVLFILAPPRSGTTLLRVMLAGHPQLFAPPELELLSFQTLPERKAAYIGRNSFWLEGTIRAIMEIKNCDVDTAMQLMADCEHNHMSTQQFYGLLQRWLGSRLLVDKTTTYALDKATLTRAEHSFSDACYIHLLRHPYAMTRSFEEIKLDQVFLRFSHPFTPHELAELIWLVSHQNILEFLQSIPAERQHRIYFEELVRQPQTVLEQLCQHFGLEFHPNMLRPYEGEKMTDGLYHSSSMLGDKKFHRYTAIESSVATQWQEQSGASVLSAVTWQLAETVGYHHTVQMSQPVERKEEQSVRLPPIQQISRASQREFPLSFAQQRLWFLNQLEPESTAYHIPLMIRLHGDLSLTTFQDSLDTLIQHHESLRTFFEMTPDGPVQVVGPSRPPFPLPQLDLRGMLPEQALPLCHQLAQEQCERPFDLSQGPLLRCLLIRLGLQDYVFLLTIHHIISDGWSMDILKRELATLYEVYIAGKPSPLPELSVQYVDFALWQRQWLQGTVLEEQLAYWRKQLAGVPALLQLPPYHPRPSVETFRGARYTFSLPPSLAQTLKMFSQDEEVTVFMTLLASFQLLLFRYSGQTDILVGTPIANRRWSKLEGLIGCFVNTLVLRTDCSGHPTFRELLSRVRKIALEAYTHQDLPFEKLVEELAPKRSLNHHPLFQIMFILHNTPFSSDRMQQKRSASGLLWHLLPIESRTAKFDLTLSVMETEQGFTASFEYNIDLFDTTSIQRMAEHWQNLLKGIIAHPDQPVALLPFLTQTEQQLLLGDWASGERSVQGEQYVHTLFEAQVERTPDAVAIVCATEHLSYGELNRRANHLAHCLRLSGVAPEVPVGICMQRSLELIIGILGILKAGGAYVPLDPAYPEERLEAMLADASIWLIVSQKQTIKRVRKREMTILCFDTLWATLPQASQENPTSSVTAENLAYVLFTSGSTGKPKGVAITHRSAVTLLEWAVTRFSPQDFAGTLASTSINFDLSVYEIFAPLCCGGTVILTENLFDLPHLPAANQVTLVNTVPSIIAEFLNSYLLPASVRTVNLAGEALSSALVQRIYEQSTVQRVLNLYGPTEDTTYTTWHIVQRGENDAPAIGRPLPGTQVYILDQYLQLVPMGGVGELYIGGEGLARGYLNRAELTAERFIPHPFTHVQQGGRLYRTGDLVLYRSDGTLEYRGRIDSQVKLRGLRIELEEIEMVLSNHHAVSQVAVLADERVPGDQRLIAYIVLRKNQTAILDELKRYVKTYMPPSMVPSTFVLLETLPTTSNGKVDHHALLASAPIKGTAETAYVAPTLPLQYQLAHIWEDLLRVQPIGINDDFFDLGGHSLLAVRLFERITRICGKRLPLSTLFAGATIEHLATVLAQDAQPDPQTPLTVVQAGGSRLPFVYLHGEWKGGAYYSKALARSLGQDRPCYLLEPYKADSQSVPASFEMMVAAHVRSLRAIQPEGPYLLGGYCNGGLVAYEIARQLYAEGQRVDLLVLIDASMPSPPRLKRLRMLISQMGKALRFHQEEQFDCFICLLHLYRYLRFSHYRRGKILEILAESEQADQRQERLTSSLGMKLKALFPSIEKLRKDYLNVLQWLVSTYQPELYPGKITFFWTREDATRRSVGWRNVARAKRGEVEIHLIPGNHLTSRVEYLDVLAERLRACLSDL